MSDGTTPRSFMVEMSGELLAQLLGGWSEPVQIKVERDPGERGGYRVTARNIESEPGSAALEARVGELQKLARDLLTTCRETYLDSEIAECERIING